MKFCNSNMLIFLFNGKMDIIQKGHGPLHSMVKIKFQVHKCCQVTLQYKNTIQGHI